ncbi:serine/threonine-protein phosphatase 4 regulatory subunit 1-like isoform X2 [Chironomus tepperi]
MEVRASLVGSGNMIQICTCLTQLDQNFVQTFGVLLLDHILSILLKFLSDEATVRKSANSTLLYLIENGFLDKKVINRNVCPVVLNLLKIDKIDGVNNDHDIQLNAIAIMAKVAPIIGMEMTHETFFDKFIEMTQSEVSNVRKQCATVFPVMCEVLGGEVLETSMLPLFVKLCEDSLWNIRNVCAQIIPMISILCSLNLRRKYLVPIMKKFMFDDSRWVIISALNSLGEFLATYASPPIVGLAYNYRLELFITNAADQEFRQQCQSNMILYSNQPNSSVIFKNLEYYETEFAKECITNQKQGNEKTTRSLSVPNANSTMKLSPSGDNEAKKMNVETYLLSIIKASHFNDRMNTSGGRLSSTTASESDECELFSIQNSINPSAILKRLSSTSDDLMCPMKGDDNNNSDDAFNNFLKFNTPLKNNFINNRSLTPETIESSFVWHMGSANSNDNDSGVLSNYQYLLKENGSEEDDDDDDDITDFDNNFNKSMVVKSYVDQNNEDTDGAADNNTSKNDSFEKKLENLTLGDKENNNNASAGSNDDTELEQFNSHQYWYIEPSNIDDLDVTVDKNELNNNNMQESNDDTSLNQSDQSTIVMDDEDNVSESSMKVNGSSNKKKLDDFYDKFYEMPPPPSTSSNKLENNEAVEVEWNLIEDFVYMKDIDNNLCFKCAFNFPAVMLTLGRKFWPLLHQHFLSLCNDLQSSVRVRKTMAKSIFQIAQIIGSENATKDLVAPFVEFFKDIDEIKIEVVKQISNFIKIIDPSKHELIVNQLEMCWLPTFNVVNWRLREQIGIQIVELNKLNNHIKKDNCVLYLTGLALKLMMDKYDCVRKVGIDAFVSCVEKSKQKKQLLKFLSFHFANSSRWRERQVYILTVDKLLEYKAIEPKMFNLYVFKKLLELVNDKIPNIRICIAKCFSVTLQRNSYYLNDNSETKKRILQEIANLKKDSDRDVRDNIIMASSDDSLTITNENDETSTLSLSEISNEISVTSTPSPPTVPLQINIYESPSTDDDESNEKSS